MFKELIMTRVNSIHRQNTIFFNFSLSIRLGCSSVNNTCGSLNPTIEVPVIKKIFHEDYVAKPVSFLNDIALLKLDSYALRQEYISSRNGT